MRRDWTGSAALAALGFLLAGCQGQSGNETAAAGNEAAPAGNEAGPASNLAEPVNAVEPVAAGQEPAQAAAGETQPPVKVGETFEVPLPQSAGTGYTWELKSPPSGTVEFLDRKVETPPGSEGSPPRTGGAQMVVFRFRAAAPGQAELVFVNRRPWKDPQPDDPSETRTITVTP